MVNTLPVLEQFYSLQGEGSNVGLACYFVRLAGCDVGCHWCDSQNSWAIKQDQYKTIEAILDDIRATSAKYVIITGGEPLMHDLTAFCELLKRNNYKVFLETSGAYPLTGCFDFICVSPKKRKLALPSVLTQAHELKIIVHNQHDFVFAEEQAKLVSSDCRLLLQPEWSRQEKMLPIIIDYIKQFPKWRLSLQTHKFISIP